MMVEQLLHTLARFTLSLEDFAPLLIQGTWVTLRLALLSLLLGLFFGLIGALTPAVVGTALASKFAGVTVVWLAMAWRLRRQRVAN